MIIYDVISDLKHKEIYISSPVFAGSLSRPAVIVPIILDAVERTKETGIMWQLTIAQIAELFKVGDPYGLYAVMGILEDYGILAKSKDGKETIYSPILEESSGVRCINAATRAASKLNILQSPRDIVSRIDLDAISRAEGGIDTNTRGFTILSYDYDAFVGKTRDLRLFAYYTDNRMDPTLIYTWFAAQGIKNIPRELEINDADVFWRTATRDFFVDHGAFQPVALSAVPWRSLDPKIVHPSTSPDLRTSKIHTVMRKITANAEDYAKAWQEDQTKFAPWPAAKGTKKKDDPPTSDHAAILRKLDGFQPPKDNPFERPEEQAEVAMSRMVASQDRLRGVNRPQQRIAENVIVKTTVIHADTPQEPRVTVNDTTGLTHGINLPKDMVVEASKNNTPSVREQLLGQLQGKLELPPKPQQLVTPPRKKVDVTSSYEVMNEIVRSNLVPEVKEIVVQFLIKGGLNEPKL